MPRLQTACTTPVAERHGRPHQHAERHRRPERRARAAAGQPPAGLPDLRQGRRVPAPGQHVQVRPRRSAASPRRSATRTRRSPARTAIVLDRERCIMCYRCVRFQQEIPGDEALAAVDRGARQRDRHARGRDLRLAVLRQHDRALPGRRADQPPVPLQGPALGPRAHAVDLHRLRGRLQHRDPRRDGQVLRLVAPRQSATSTMAGCATAAASTRCRRSTPRPARAAGARRRDAARASRPGTRR